MSKRSEGEKEEETDFSFISKCSGFISAALKKNQVAHDVAEVSWVSLGKKVRLVFDTSHQ